MWEGSYLSGANDNDYHYLIKRRFILFLTDCEVAPKSNTAGHYESQKNTYFTARRL